MFHHRKGFVGMEPTVGALPASIKGAQEGRLFLFGDAGGGNVRVQELFGIMVSRNFVALFALLVQPKPESFSLRIVVFDIHTDNRADSCEAEQHHADQCAVSKADERIGVDGF